MPQAAIANLVAHAAEEIALAEAPLEQQSDESIRRALLGGASGTAVVPLMTRAASLARSAVRLQPEPTAKGVPVALPPRARMER
jgi:hypothetical protein